MKKLFIIASTLFLSGCAGVDWNTVGNAVLTDLTQGAIVAQDAYTAYNALNQNLTTANVATGKLTVAKVLAAAQAGSTALNTPGLGTAVSDFVTDAQATITALQAKGATTPATIQAVSQQGAATVSTVSAIASAPPSTQ